MTKQEAAEQFKKLTNGLPKEQQDAIAAALENDSFVNGVTEWGMLKADYSKNKNEVAAERKKAEEEYAAKYSQLQTWAQQHGKTIEQAQAIYDKYQKYAATYGELQEDGTVKQQTQTTPSLTPEQITKLLDERDQRMTATTAGFLKSAFKLNTDHQKNFGEPLDIEGFEDWITEARKRDPQLGIDSAYDKYVAPKLEAKRQADVTAQIKAAREEGAREALSKHKLPIDAGPKEYAPAWDPQRHELNKKSAEELDDHARNGFFEEWAKVGAESKA